jgi:hypothetical protein
MSVYVRLILRVDSALRAVEKRQLARAHMVTLRG